MKHKLLSTLSGFVCLCSLALSIMAFKYGVNFVIAPLVLVSFIFFMVSVVNLLESK